MQKRLNPVYTILPHSAMGKCGCWTSAGPVQCWSPSCGTPPSPCPGGVVNTVEPENRLVCVSVLQVPLLHLCFDFEVSLKFTFFPLLFYKLLVKQDTLELALFTCIFVLFQETLLQKKIFSKVVTMVTQILKSW